MLGANELAVRAVGEEVIPEWLTERDHGWLRVLLEEVDSFVGRPVDALELELPERLRVRLGGAVSRRRLLAARRTLLAGYPTHVEATVPPPTLRRMLFGRAAARPVREVADVARAVAHEVGLPLEDLLAAVFSDRPGARCLLPGRLSSPLELAQHTNLGLAQALLARSEGAIIRCGEHARAVFRLAKLRRLICAAHRDAAGPRVHVSGPLALFHRTTKYGGAFAAFLPALVATPTWSLEAACVIDGQSLLFRADASLPLARTHVLPRAHDSDVERRLDRDLRKLASGWVLSREADVIQVGDRLFFPDFTLTRGEHRVLVEIVGFYTKDYLVKKLEALRAVRDLPIVVLLDQDLACEDSEVPGNQVLRYRRHPDALAVIRAAEAAVAGRSLPTRDGRADRGFSGHGEAASPTHRKKVEPCP